MWQRISITLLWLCVCQATDPRFDPTTLMRLVQVPADAAVGSVIYRLRATDEDFDYPLQFDLVGDAAKSIVAVETLACTKYNSVCQANLILQRKLEAGRYYDFKISVRDTKGGNSVISCSISATNATTPKDIIFPHIPGLIMIPEDAKRGADLDYVVARKNPRFTKPVYLELWGSPLFAIRQRLISAEETEGVIFLLGPLDYEKQATYHLTILANDAYAEPGQDSRNIAGLPIVVVVRDVQDMPPIFTSAPPITKLDNSLLPGDIVARVHAEDGDKGSPRAIRYGLVSEGNPFTPFFNISESNGEIILARPLEEITAISHVGDPIILTVVAEEVRLSLSEPEAMSTTVQLAFILGERGNQPPYFANDNYVARIDENAPQGITVIFTDPYTPEVSDDDMGKNGVFALSLENNNGTFEISPSVAERHTTFLISVRDNTLLDYEVRKTVRFKILAQELGPSSNLSTSVDVVVFLNDVNDNPPAFLQDEYIAEFPENATAGTRVVQVHAEDPDTGQYGKIRYTQILGYLNTSLSLDAETGLITIATSNHGFDCEAMPEYRLYVEATDENGVGNRATVPLIIKLIDINDEPPVFERALFEFILSPSLRNFTYPAFIKAVDKDISKPNNVVRYEIVHGNYENHFILNEITGELTLREPLRRTRHRRQIAPKEAEVYILTARAYDLGIPHLSSTCQINIYPPESRARIMLFIVAGKNPDRIKTEETLAAITGGKVTIQEIRPYSGDEVGATDVTHGDTTERSVVVASVSYGKNSVIDVSHLQNTLGRNRTAAGGNTYTEDSNAPYKAESNVIFWLLMVLAILIILALIILILCCICAGCPLYMPPKKRIIRVNSTDDDVHLVVKEKGLGKDNKSIQATRKEAWSADLSESRTRPTQWQFNKRNVHNKEKMAMQTESEDLNGTADINGALKSKHIHDDSTLRMTEGPNVIYSRELQNRQHKRKERDIYLEDYETDYQTPRSHRKRPIDDDLETESLRRHEIERGSDREYKRIEFEDTRSLRGNFRRQHATTEEENDGGVILQDGREQLYIREGNTEILRLLTRGRPEEEKGTSTQQQQRPVTFVQQPQYIVLDSGKNILMQRFIEQQLLQQQESQSNVHHRSNPSVILPNEIPASRKSSQSSIHSSAAESKRTAYNLVHQELLETSLRQQNELLRQILLEKERLDKKQEELMQQEEARLETQSLPGHSVIATQTDCNTSTQTEPQYLRPPKRQTRSDNDESLSDDDDFHLYIIKQTDDKNGIRWVKRRRKLKRRRFKDLDKKNRRVVAEIRRHIKTPIMEECESPLESNEKRKDRIRPKNTKMHIRILKKIQTEDVTEPEEEVLQREDKEEPKKESKYRQDTLYYDSNSEEDDKLYRIKGGKLAELISEDSQEYDIEDDEGVNSERSKMNSTYSYQGSSAETRVSNETDKTVQSREKSASRSCQTSQEEEEKNYKNLRDHQRAYDSEQNESAKSDRKKLDVAKSTPRYMQWYNKKDGKPKDKEIMKRSKKTPQKSKSILADSKSSSIKKVFPTENKTEPDEEDDQVSVKSKSKKDAKNNEPQITKEKTFVADQQKGTHALVQHSEYRYEHPNQIPPPVYPQTVQYIATTPVGIPAPIVTLMPNVPAQLQQISVQPKEVQPQRNKTPDKPPRPNLKKTQDSANGKTTQQPLLKAPGGIEEDYDSGIAMASLVQDVKKKNQITEKKSIFTIAYDDMHTKQLLPDSSSPPY